MNDSYISLNIAAATGVSYLLHFQLQAKYVLKPDYGFWVEIDQTPVAILSVRTQGNTVLRTDSANQWALFSIPPVATGGTTEVGFASFVECNRDGCDIDLFLDGVSISEVGGEAAVPEPGVGQMLVLGLTAAMVGGAAAFRRGCYRQG